MFLRGARVIGAWGRRGGGDYVGYTSLYVNNPHAFISVLAIPFN